MATLSLVHGNAESAMQSMDKNDLIHYLYVIAICLAAGCGYLAGIHNG
jgi:hypothetical protein